MLTSGEVGTMPWSSALSSGGKIGCFSEVFQSLFSPVENKGTMQPNQQWLTGSRCTHADDIAMARMDLPPPHLLGTKLHYSIQYPNCVCWEDNINLRIGDVHCFK